MQDLLADLLKQATRKGATEADAFVVEDQSFSAQVRLGQVDTVKHAREQHMALRVFVGQSVAAASSSDLSRESVARLVDEAVSLARITSPDELSVYIARQLMRQLAPSLLWITMHDIDIAHAGAYSLYIEGIQRTDRLCAELWKTIQSEPEYAGNTTLFILPDFGRDSDDDAGGNGFQHHRTGDALSRTTWMIALGAGVREGVVYDRPIDSTDLVPTLGSILGFYPAFAKGKPIVELV